MRLALALALLPSLTTAQAGSPTVELRPVDRATVRVLTLSGVVSRPVTGRQTRVRRLLAAPRSGHGSGLVVDGPGGLVLTARHVVWGADLVAVLLPGTDEVRPARVAYSDPDHDIAFLRVDGPLPAAVALPEASARRLRVGEAVSASGYPLELREPFPAAAFGRLSRVRRDGTLQLDMHVNPGNSGGPLVDGQGRLLGMLVARGDVRRGVEGLALAEPVPRILVARRRLPASDAPFGEVHRAVARILADFSRTDDRLPLYEQTSVETLDRAAGGAVAPESQMLVAAHAWNMLMAYLEDHGARDLEALDPAERPVADHLRQTVEGLLRDVLARSDYVRLRYPAVRGIAVGLARPYLPDP
jgi:S1-C subfamily serine protease